ncbi:MAG: hypothetical protein J6W64_07630 [Bacilli bacterium]|nr:hypothetical protein [Bacilli bacterium]
MEAILESIVNYGIGVVCVGYLIYFQSTTMKEMLHTLGTINERLTIIEEIIEDIIKDKNVKVIKTNKKKSGD